MKIKSKFVKIAFIFLCLLSVLFLFFKFNQVQSKIFVKSNGTTQAFETNNKSVDDYFKTKTPFNILLLGYGGGNHDGAYLTDSMIVVHIDPSTKRVVLISIPRDIWVKIPTNGDKGSYWKINAAYELGLDDTDYPNKQVQFKGAGGGGRLAEYMISQVTGLPIQYFVGMDFTGFKNTIDSLGGVDINVEVTFTDPEYPIDGKEDDLCGHLQSDLPILEAQATQSAVETVFPCRYENLHFDAGAQHMNGGRALSYVRSRHSLQDGTDFGRSKRQRNLLVAVKQKIIDIGFIPKVIPFINSLQDDLRTDLSLDELRTFIQQSNDLGKYQISNLALTDQNVLNQNFTEDGQYTLISKDSTNNWDSIHNWIQNSLDLNKTILSPVIKVENGTNVAGLATLAYNRLQNRDFNLLPPVSSEQKIRVTTITIYNDHIDSKIIDDLKKEFGVQQISTGQASDLSYDILIVLGDDYNLTQGKKMIN